MYKLSEIKELIKIVDQSSLQEFEIQNDNYRLFIRKPQSVSPSVAIPSVPVLPIASPTIHNEVQPISTNALTPQVNDHITQQASTSLSKITSPMVGTFYRASSPGATPFIEVGTKVSEKTVVCIIEAMKLMNDIEAEIKGEIVEILVENGQLVEFGQPLFLVKAD